MGLKELLPATAVTGGRLLRTHAVLAGLIDRQERRLRAEALGRMLAQRRAAARDRRVLVFSFRGGWYPHTAWESVLAHALRLRGACVHVFNCGGQLPICEVNFRHATPTIACRECAAYPGELTQRLKLDHSWLRDYITPLEQSDIRALVDRLQPGEFEAWTYDGQPVGALVHNSVLWFLRKSAIDLMSDEAVYRDFLVAGASIARLAPRLARAVRPDVVLELNGRFFAEQILNRVLGPTVKVVTYEAGWRMDTLGFDQLSEEAPVDLDEAWEASKDRPLTDNQNRQLDAWIESRAAGDMQRDFYIRFDRQREDPLQALGLDPAKPTAVLFTNLVWDTAVLGRNSAFPSISEWLTCTIREFVRCQERQLVIRVHPAEDLRPSQESAEKLGNLVRQLAPLPSNIRLVPSAQPLSSYALIKRCQAVLVYTSTTGLEAALWRKRVLVSAQVYYRNRGFTTDVSTPEDYVTQLEQVMDAEPPVASQVELARRFAYLLLFQYLQRIPVVKQRPRQLPLLEPEEADELLPGASLEFDRLLGALLEGGPFLR